MLIKPAPLFKGCDFKGGIIEPDMENEGRSAATKFKAYLGMFVIAAAVFCIDQLSKYWIRTHLTLRETIAPIPALENVFRIIHWKNTGIAFGLFQGNGWILTLIGIIIVIGIILFSAQVISGPAFWRVAMAMELGGALGNLADRLNPALGYVVDFIWIGNFPVFNLADAAIVIGAFILLLGMMRQDQAEKNMHAGSDGGDISEGEEKDG